MSRASLLAKAWISLETVLPSWHSSIWRLCATQFIICHLENLLFLHRPLPEPSCATSDLHNWDLSIISDNYCGSSCPDLLSYWTSIQSFSLNICSASAAGSTDVTGSDFQNGVWALLKRWPWFRTAFITWTMDILNSVHGICLTPFIIIPWTVCHQ